jgi:hypothetical protein
MGTDKTNANSLFSVTGKAAVVTGAIAQQLGLADQRTAFNT